MHLLGMQIREKEQSMNCDDLPAANVDHFEPFGKKSTLKIKYSSYCYYF